MTWKTLRRDLEAWGFLRCSRTSSISSRRPKKRWVLLDHILLWTKFKLSCTSNPVIHSSYCCIQYSMHWSCVRTLDSKCTPETGKYIARHSVSRPGKRSLTDMKCWPVFDCILLYLIPWLFLFVTQSWTYDTLHWRIRKWREKEFFSGQREGVCKTVSTWKGLSVCFWHHKKRHQRPK